MYDLKEEIEFFQKYDLNDYHHEQWTTGYEGSMICDFILKLINHIEKLEEKIDKLQNNDV